MVSFSDTAVFSWVWRLIWLWKSHTISTNRIKLTCWHMFSPVVKVIPSTYFKNKRWRSGKFPYLFLIFPAAKRAGACHSNGMTSSPQMKKQDWQRTIILPKWKLQTEKLNTFLFFMMMIIILLVCGSTSAGLKKFLIWTSIICKNKIPVLHSAPCSCQYTITYKRN